MDKDTIKKVILQLLVWGFGAVLAIAGGTLLFICSIGVVEGSFPAYIICGSILMGIGMIIYLVEYILNGYSKFKKN